MHNVTPVEHDHELDRARKELDTSKENARSAFAELRALLEQMSEDMRKGGFPVTDATHRRHQRESP